MSWSVLIPSSMLSLGAVLCVLAVLLVYLDVPGQGVEWDKVAAVAALVGGFGVGGAGAGWIGGLLTALAGGAVTGAGAATAQLVGVSTVGAVGFAVGLWAYSRLRGGGISARTRTKSLLVVAALGVVGTVASTIPNLYGAADALVGSFAAALT